MTAFALCRQHKISSLKSARLAFDAITSFSAPFALDHGFGFDLPVGWRMGFANYYWGVSRAKRDGSRMGLGHRHCDFMGGVQLLYRHIRPVSGATFEETKHRPLYFLRSKNRDDVQKGLWHEGSDIGWRV